MTRSYLFAFAASSLLAGCTVTTTPSSSSSSGGFGPTDGAEYNYLFDAPRSTPTAGKMNGIWSAESAETQYRFELKASELVIGGRCGDMTVGNEDPATFADDRMVTSKQLFVAANHNGKACGVSFPKLDAKTCDDKTFPCFTLSGLTLTLKNTGEKDLVLTKVSD